MMLVIRHMAQPLKKLLTGSEIREPRQLLCWFTSIGVILIPLIQTVPWPRIHWRWHRLMKQQTVIPPAPGNQYVIQTAVRRLSDNDTVSAELAPGVLQGQVYYVKMQQFIYYDWPLGDIVFELVVAGENENGLPVNPRAPGGLGQIIDPTEDENGDRDTVTGHGDYPEAVISCRAQFYALPNVLYSYINGASFSLADADNNGHPDTTGKPVYTRNIAVSR